ncbi:hypothetical protein PF008_g15096 [Phytophthora fragariae]|uniref:Uncharacterized protein n=1 Tax=Phytophthora fragariae TaxID=53985 RepID=A0A6G0RF46_9STRA|nr:hypothetical protein PF008_g15096 [Phytophthora fragariae]
MWVCKEADDGFQEAVKDASTMVEKAEATLKRAQDKLKAVKEKSDAAVKEMELVSWGKKKAVESEQSKALMGVIEAATKTNNVERAYLEAQRCYQELRSQEMDARPLSIDKVMVETIPNPYI